jgi:hypothetical protein
MASDTGRAPTEEIVMVNPFESVRVVWNETDEQFFRSTAEVFTAEFARGATVLLASYDPTEAAA